MPTADPSLDMTADPDRFDEAIREFSQRRIITKAEADAMEAYARRRAWWIAGVAQMDVVNDVHASIRDAKERGIPFEEWKSGVEDKLTNAWGRTNSPRIQLIFRNATMQAANAGRWEQMHQPNVLQVRPFLIYDAIRDSHECPRCEKCNGVTLPADDPWWETHSPILHHACRCGLRNVRREVAEKRGVTKTPPSVTADDGFGVPPTEQVPPTPSDRKNPPAPAIHATFTEKSALDRKERVPKAVKINPLHTPEYWEPKYEHYGEAKRKVAYGRALLERAKELKAADAYEVLKDAYSKGVPGIKAWDMDHLRVVAQFPKRGDPDLVNAYKLLAQHLKFSGTTVSKPEFIEAEFREIQRKAQQWFEAMASPKLEVRADISWVSADSEQRSHYHRARKQLAFTPDANYGVAVHEWGHAIEDTGKLLELSKAFKRAREQGQQLEKLSDLFEGSNYRDDELAIPDKYFHAYMGKHYDDYTEILSMIFQTIAEGKIVKLLKKDPESLFFALGVLAGA